MTADPAETLKLRLRDDLRNAMRAKATTEVSVIRGLIGALDNAQAVPVGDGHQRYQERAFGDPANEVARLSLDEAGIRAVLAAEIATRTEAAAQFVQLGRLEQAADLHAQAALIARY